MGHVNKNEEQSDPQPPKIPDHCTVQGNQIYMDLFGTRDKPTKSKTVSDDSGMKTVTIVSMWTKFSTRAAEPYVYDLSVQAAPGIETMLRDAYHETNRDGRPFEKSSTATTAGDLMIVDDSASW